MKVYILYKDVGDEPQVVGIFSSQEKVERAIEIFSPLEEGRELTWEDFEVDELEKIFDAALSGYQFYHLSTPKYSLSSFFKTDVFNDRYVYSMGIDSFLGDRKEFVYETNELMGASIRAKSEKEAIERANELLEEQRKQNEST